MFIKERGEYKFYFFRNIFHTFLTLYIFLFIFISITFYIVCVVYHAHHVQQKEKIPSLPNIRLTAKPRNKKNTIILLVSLGKSRII